VTAQAHAWSFADRDIHDQIESAMRYTGRGPARDALTRARTALTAGDREAATRALSRALTELHSPGALEYAAMAYAMTRAEAGEPS